MIVQLSKGRRGAPLCKTVGSYREASEAVRAYIEHGDLPYSRFTGGPIAEGGKIVNSRFTGGPIAEGGKIVAHVSYNGRVWAGTEWTPGATPLYDPIEQQRRGIFRDHSCYRCKDGVLPCVRGNAGNCGFPHARND
jgi:hypothetical protein